MRAPARHDPSRPGARFIQSSELINRKNLAGAMDGTAQTERATYGEEILREETGRARSGEEDGSRFTSAASRMEEKKRDTDIERRPTVEKPRQQTPLLSPFIFCRRSILHPLPQPTAQSRSGKKRENNMPAGFCTWIIE